MQSFVDGIIAATGCHVGGRTLRILDFGKVAATFIDTRTEESIRIIPKRESRALSADYAPSHKAFAALDAEKQAALRQDLETLWSEFNSGTDGGHLSMQNILK